MATCGAHIAAENFEDWLTRAQAGFEEHASGEQKAMGGGFLYPSYEIAHHEWLFQGGFDHVACDYFLAIEVLLVILSLPEDQRTVHIPTVSNDDPHTWEHMTEAGFRRALYQWRKSNT